jgi:hypothetical protein
MEEASVMEHDCARAELSPRNIGQFAGQGVPFKHCQDARAGITITSKASDSREPIHLR